ncbi:MAG: dockerin type I domain-containing protein [Pseudomonadota bacterium]
MLRFSGIAATGTAGFDTGIGDLTLKTFNGDTYLYSASGSGGGIVAWRLSAGSAPVRHDDQVFADSISALVARKLMPVTLAGTDHLVLDVDTATGLVSYDLATSGQIGALQETAGLNGGGDITALTQASDGLNDFVVIVHDTTDRIVTYRIGGDGSLSPTDSWAGQAAQMQALGVGGSQFVIATDTVNGSVLAYRLDMASGTLSPPDTQGADQGLGMNTPTALEVVEAHGASWVIVAASESNSISVLQLGADGQLTATDHLLDTLGTRFEKVQDLALVQAGDHVFVVAGGGDDGLSLFTLTPQGKLVYLDSFADTLQSGLQNVAALEAASIGTELQIFATSQEEAGITQMTVALDNLGAAVQGTGALNGTAGDDMLSGGTGAATITGGAGNDILIAATGTTAMTGGAGADIFVMRAGSGETTITDFQAGTDRLDLFDFPLLRNLDQLSVTYTAQGAQLQYQGNTVTIRSESGTTLDIYEIFPDGLTGPDHVPLIEEGGATGGGSPGVVGQITVTSDGPNPGLSDAEIRFTPDGGALLTALADAQGQFDLALPPGSAPGRLEIVKSYSTASAEITALDALQVLRLAVGLDPTWGTAAPENLIAADITRDGSITALDALEVLRAAVGQQGGHIPEWVFVDADADLSGITPGAVTYQTGAAITAADGSFSTDMTSILLGNMIDLS